MDDITEDDQVRLLTDPGSGMVAPMALWRPMQRLAGATTKVVAAACSMSSAGEDRTVWRVAWLTDSVVVLGEASKTVSAAWTAHSHDQVPDEVEVKMRSLQEVRSVRAIEPAGKKHGDGSWSWTERYEVVFRDYEMQLPLFAHHPAGAAGQQPALELLAQMTSRL